MINLTFGTVCDGIGCGHLAFDMAGFECAWSFEIEPFPSAVLAYRFPEVKNHGDMNKAKGMIERRELEAPDVFIGGCPCQAFSVAGKREGLDDARGNLSLTFCGIVDAIDAVREREGTSPCAVLYENVPGLLSDKGNAFGCFLGELSGSGCELKPAGRKWGNAGCVFGPKRTVAWRVLDSQFFGVAQRRRRVFVVASAGDRFRPEEILFERDGVRRDTPPSRETRQGIASDAGSGAKVGHWDGGDCHPSLTQSYNTGGIGASNQELFSQRGSGLVPTFRMTAFGEYSQDGTASTLKQRDHKDATDLIATYDMRGNGDGDTVGTLTVEHAGRPTDYTPVVTFAQNTRDEVRVCNGDGAIAGALAAEPGMKQQTYVAIGFGAHTLRGDGFDASEDGSGRRTPLVPTPAIGWSEELTASIECAGTIQRGGSGGRHEGVMTPAMQVRRLTPCECEALQGLPRNWTLIPWRGKPASECPDGPRYKGIGNGQTVPVMLWLAKRIMSEIKK